MRNILVSTIISMTLKTCFISRHRLHRKSCWRKCSWDTTLQWTNWDLNTLVSCSFFEINIKMTIWLKNSWELTPLNLGVWRTIWCDTAGSMAASVPLILVSWDRLISVSVYFLILYQNPAYQNGGGCSGLNYVTFQGDTFKFRFHMRWWILNSLIL